MRRAPSITLPNGLHAVRAGECLRIHGATADGRYGCVYVMRDSLRDMTPHAASAYIAAVFATWTKPATGHRARIHAEGHSLDAIAGPVSST